MILFVSCIISEVMSQKSQCEKTRLSALPCNIECLMMCLQAILYFVIVMTDIGVEFGDVRPLGEARMRALTVNHVHLLDLIDSNPGFVSELASPTVGCITREQRDYLLNIGQPRERNKNLLECLTRRSVANFNQFTEVLSKYQADLVALLVTDGGETFLLCE